MEWARARWRFQRALVFTRLTANFSLKMDAKITMEEFHLNIASSSTNAVSILPKVNPYRFVQMPNARVTRQTGQGTPHLLKHYSS
jgi:hypothetical protein